MNDIASRIKPFTDAQATLASMREESLAKIVAALLNENEPMLRAEQDGATVIVRERGGGAEMRFTVMDQFNNSPRGGEFANNGSPTDQ